MIALVLVHLAAIVLIAGLRFPHALDLVFGMPVAPERWAMLSGVLVCIAALALRREIAEGRAPWAGLQRVALWSALVLAPALVWSLGDAEATLGIDLVVLGGAGLLGWMVVLRRPAARTREFWVGGSRAWWIALGGITAVAIAALAVQSGVRTHSLWPWLTYPFYALLQLGVLLELPERIWRHDGVGRAGRVLGLAVLFALVHGPNPLVLGLTALGMTVWALARTAGVGLVPIALSMGLLGATVARVLPEVETQNMRVGPGYVIKRSRARVLDAYVQRVNDLASDASFVRAGGNLAGWLDLVHREVFDRPIDARTREAWITLLRQRLREQVVRITLESPEYRQRHGIQRLMIGPDRSLLYSTFRPWHPAQEAYAELSARAADRVHEEEHADFVRHVYETLQGRTPSEGEVAAWQPYPDLEGRIEIVRRFLLEAGIPDPGHWDYPGSPKVGPGSRNEWLGPEIAWPGASDPDR